MIVTATQTDVPSPIDFHDLAQARKWEADTVRNRPWRPEFFAAFVSALNATFDRPFSLLELGSGPGHLAEHILSCCDVISYTALDFSPAMHELARARLTKFAGKVDFVLRDFTKPGWDKDLGKFDAVATMQAAHEVRHVRHLPRLLRDASELIVDDGLFLYCDHYAGARGPDDPELYLRPEEQPLALEEAGFYAIEKRLDKGGMALYSARISTPES